MVPNPLLEEVWRVKDQLAEEAGCDVQRFCDQLQEWSALHRHKGPVMRDAKEFQRLVAGENQKKKTTI